MEQKAMKEPKTLQEAILYFSDPDRCLEYIVARRWPDGIVKCPTCDSADVRFLPNQRRWECKGKHPKRQFSVKVGTVMEDSPIGLDKWLSAMWMLVNDKNGVSSYEIHRALGVTQKSAWFLDHRIRLALQQGSLVKLGKGGKPVEVDETFIGGKSCNMHKSVRDRRIKGRGYNIEDKTLVMGMLERNGHVRTEIIPDRKRETLHPLVRENVSAGTALYSDDWTGYVGLDEYERGVVDHATCYVDGKVHTNGMENFWSLLKRGLSGTYVSVEPFHLFRYLDEQAFRFNNRGGKKRENRITDADRMNLAMQGIVGKRVTYKELTGKAGERTNN
jgi:transposase-like protein